MAPQKPFLINALRGKAERKIYCHQFYDALRFMFIDDLIIIFVFWQRDPRIDPHDFYEVFFCIIKRKMFFLSNPHDKSKEFLYLLLQD